MTRGASCCTKAGCMSTTSPMMGDTAELIAPARPRDDFSRFETPIVPRNSISGRALIAVVAIMTFLASMTVGAVILIQNAASDWQSDVAREVTIQVRPVAGRDIEADVQRAAALARGIPGAADVRAMS